LDETFSSKNATEQRESRLALKAVRFTERERDKTIDEHADISLLSARQDHIEEKAKTKWLGDKGKTTLVPYKKRSKVYRTSPKGA
jgi:hypothetical protein